MPSWPHHSEFDNLPNSAHVRLPVVMALYGCGKETVRRRVRDGLMPKPRKFGARMVAWNVGDLRDHLASQSPS